MQRTVLDRLVGKLYDDFKINLVAVPRTDILPGQAVLWVLDAQSAVGPMSLETIVAGKVKVPEPDDPRPSGAIEREVSDYREKTGQAKLFGGLLSKLLPGLLGQVEAEGEAKSSGEFSFSFQGVKQRSIDPAALRTALKGQTFDLTGFAAAASGHSKRVFVIVDTFSADCVEIRWRDGDGKQLSADLALPEIAQLSGSNRLGKSQRGSVIVKGEPGLVFGVRLLELQESDGLIYVKLEHSKLKVLDKERVVDDRDYAVSRYVALSFGSD